MGIHKEIRTFLKGWNHTGSAFFSTSALPASFKDESIVVLQDMMIEIHNVAFMKGRAFTGAGLVGRLLESMLKYREERDKYNLAVWVLCVDQPQYNIMPKLRHADEEDASKFLSDEDESKLFKYPDGTTFDVDGVHFPDGTIQHIDVNRLLHPSNRPFRRHWWEFMRSFIAANVRFKDMWLIFDFECVLVPHGPIATFGDRAVRLPFHAHRLAEADLSMVYWSRVFCDYQILVLTTDTDTLPLFAWSLLAQTERNQRVYWQYSPTDMVNLGKLTRKLQEDALVNIKDWNARVDPSVKTHSVMRFGVPELLACANMLGNDYLRKSDFSPNKGLVKFLLWLQEIPLEVCAPMCPLTNEGDVMDTEFARFMSRVHPGSWKVHPSTFTMLLKRFNDLMSYWYPPWESIALEERKCIGVASLQRAFDSMTGCQVMPNKHYGESFPCRLDTDFQCNCNCPSGNLSSAWVHAEFCASVVPVACECPLEQPPSVLMPPPPPRPPRPPPIQIEIDEVEVPIPVVDLT